MAESSLKARLQEHAEAFDGLLSLIPAKIYYGTGDNSDQWKKKKQTKAQADAALRAKLDPDSIKTAKDVMDENAARKRKLEDTDDYSDIEGVEKELPKQGLRDGEKKNNKKQKKDATAPSTLSKPNSKEDVSQAKAAAAAKRREKAEKKKEKQTRKAEKKKAKKQDISEEKVALESEDKVEAEAETETETAPAEDDEWIDVDTETMNPISVDGLVEEQEESASSSPAETPVFESNDQSANTSTSSVIPPAKAPKHIKLPSDPELLRKRLAAKIESLRAARKADGPNGAPARNRQELIESRRMKEEQRRAHKKELRRLAAIEEANQREEALASARDSPASSMMGSRRHSPEHSFSFGRVAFADGQSLTSDLSSLVAPPKKKGPQDAATALQAAENKRLRIAGLDDEKRADIEEKDLWLNAKKRAHGERVRDDTSLLKKTLKRKEKAKKKSEKEWGERKEGVAKGIAMKQKKREENLQKRKDGKGVSGKGKGKGSGTKKKGKAPLKRPGFEGSFTTKKR